MSLLPFVLAYIVGGACGAFVGYAFKGLLDAFPLSRFDTHKPTDLVRTIKDFSSPGQS